MGSGRASGPEAGAAGDGPAAGEASAGPAGATAATTRTPMGNHEVEALPLPVVGLCSGGGEGDFFTGRSIGPTCERNPAVTTASRTHQWKGGWRMAAAAASHSGHGDDHSGGSSISGTSGRYGSGAAAEAFLSRRERPTRRSRRERRSMESGVTTVPPLFCAPTMAVPQAPSTPSPDSFTILVVDLSLPRSDTVALVRAAARSCGFFHVTNHRVPADIVGAAARAFHEQPLAACSALYSPDPVVGSVAYSTIPITQRRRRRHGVDAAPTLPWRDSLRVRFGPGEPELGGLPAWCRDALQVYQRLLKGFEEEMAGLLSEALGVGAARLEQELQVRGWLMACHYYPPCPEPTVGSLEHMDGMDGKPWDPLLEVELEGL